MLHRVAYRAGHPVAHGPLRIVRQDLGFCWSGTFTVGAGTGFEWRSAEGSSGLFSGNDAGRRLLFRLMLASPASSSLVLALFLGSLITASGYQEQALWSANINGRCNALVPER